MSYVNGNINYWCERYNRTEQDLFNAAELYLRVANLVYAASRERILNRCFDYKFASNNSQVIRDKVKRTLDKGLSSCIKFGSDQSIDMLGNAIRTLGLKKQPKAKGICRNISMSDYLLLSDFNYFIAQKLFNNPFLNDTFELRNAVWDLVQYLLLLDTLEHGFEKESMNKISYHLVSTKEPQFFDNGYPLDFFVHDREFSNRNKRTVIACYQDRISTWIYSGIDAFRRAKEDSMEGDKLIFENY
ncbi:hypothetical protein VIBNISOn1_1050032 [Vibrio nigripulchritudo SOn1]|uniref:HEPN domain-containing protein n=1 Tax=Vibrio nigripulchritudo SOn1 TaxID=1238450 RepID=A0AAV2VI41_9VIBR|nr:hypothetical protein [Vibrio nigripulchritudo]CCO44206.1 hypothetical protein VIBNISOn1_1050032 [Vibrio nigripulchritudo SOn1]